VAEPRQAVQSFSSRASGSSLPEDVGNIVDRSTAYPRAWTWRVLKDGRSASAVTATAKGGVGLGHAQHENSHESPRRPPAR
jgi:hypothetical protein